MKFGINRLIEDLQNQGYDGASVINDSAGQTYALISEYRIPAGTFEGCVIELAIPAPPQYPQQYGASIQVRSNPPLVGIGHIPNVRNVQDSPLKNGWQYWSYRFTLPPSNPTNELITQINGIFKKN
jgi:hypothetical protein